MLLVQGTLMALALTLAAPAGATGKNIAAELERGEKLFKAGDLGGALQAYDNAAKLDPKDARPVYLRGVVLEKKGDAAGAERAYRDAIARDGRFAPARNNLGAILLGRNDLAAAEKELTAASTADPKNASAAFNVGLLREAQKQPREAAASYRKALQIRPNDGTARANLCAVLRRLGDLDGAIAECRQAARLLPGNAVALTNLGLLLSDKGNYDEARETLRQATAADSKFAPAFTGLGRVELRRKQPGPAVEALAKAVKLLPKDGGIAADYCRALVEKDLRAKDAEEACRKAATLDPNNALARYELVKVLVGRGDCAGAKVEHAKLSSLAAVKPQAKAKAEEILGTCVAGKAAKPGAAKVGK